MDHDVCRLHCDLQREHGTGRRETGELEICFGEKGDNVLERGGIKVNRRKTEYMWMNERQDNGSSTEKMQGEEVAIVDDFKYLGSTVQSNGECGRKNEEQSTGRMEWVENREECQE